MFENRGLVKIFGHKSQEVRGWRKLYIEELHVLYSSANIRVIISRTLR
jgi:hypothetical protein